MKLKEKIDDFRLKHPRFYCGLSVMALNCLFISLALPIAMMIIGSYYLSECPLQKYIPTWLIVQGSFTVFMIIFVILWYLFQELLKRKCMYRTLATTLILSALFIFTWCITGSVWIYSITNIYQSKDSFYEETYCQETLYLFAFWSLTVFNILIGLGFLVSFVFLVKKFSSKIR